MTSDPARPVSPSRATAGDLPLRALSGVVMAAVALLLNWIGGMTFNLFWAAAALVVLWEWIRLVEGSPQRAVWIAAGLVYAAVLAAAPILLRSDARYGMLAIFFLFGVVWVTDIGAYFVGRLVGGPKLWPAVSPNKTWSGAIGGTLGAVAAGVIVAICGAIAAWPAAIMAAVLSIASQAGDLFESHLKRRFNAKDSSHLIPGHGGAMDRLDGFIAAAAAAALIGFARGGLVEPGRGMLIW